MRYVSSTVRSAACRVFVSTAPMASISGHHVLSTLAAPQRKCLKKHLIYTHWTSVHCSAPTKLRHVQRKAIRHSHIKATAMINVDGSPPLFLGAGMIAAGAILYQLRNSRPYVTKDFDIVLSCIAIFAGGILVFQGWRLDPLLLFGQLLTAGAALSFGVEALRLREIVYKKELSEANAYDAQAAQPGQGPRYPEALPLPQSWDQPQAPPAPPASPSEVPQPWWEEQQARVAQFDQSSDSAPGSSGQDRQESWPDRPNAYSDQQKYSGGQNLNQQRSGSNQGSEGRYPGDSVNSQSNSSGQQLKQPRSQSSSSQPRQQGRSQKSWGSDIDLGSLDDWDST